MTKARSQTFLMLVGMLIFSFGGGLIGSYVATQQMLRGQQAQNARLKDEIDRVSVATLNAVTALATDTEIIAADIVDLGNRLDVLEVKANDMGKSMSMTMRSR
jgi:hypothetical protein